MCRASEDLDEIARQIDGCYHGDPADDVISDCYEVEGIHHVVAELRQGIDPYLVEPPEQP